LIKKIYLLFYYFSLFLVAIGIASLFVFSQKHLLNTFADKYLKESGVKYSHIEWSLFNGIIVHDLKYEEAISIKRVQVHYNLLYLFRATPKISKIEADAFTLDVSKLAPSDENQTQTSLIAFAVSNLELKHTKLILKDETYLFDVKAKEFSFDEKIDVGSVTMELNSTYVNAIIEGTIKSNKFDGNASVEVKESLTIKDAKIEFSYSVNTNYYQSTLHATLEEEPLKFPAQTLSAELFGDESGMGANIKTDLFDLNISSKDYEIYEATLYPKLEDAFYKPYPMKLFLPIKMRYENISKNQKLTLDANLLHATLTQKEKRIKGYGTLASAQFTLSTQENNSKVLLHTKVLSIKKLLAQLHLRAQEESMVHDGEAEIDSTFDFAENFSMKNDFHMPWYTITLDDKKSYLLKDIFLSSTYSNDNFVIESYKANYLEQKFYSDKPSTIFTDENKNIVIKEFWLYDNLLATGFIDTTKREVNIALKSDKFSYYNKDINISAKADLHASMDALGKQKIEGTVTLLDGVVSYEPRDDFTVRDRDIIVIQEMKKARNSNSSMRININAFKPITYKTKEITLHFSPDMSISQEPNAPLKLLGMVTIHDGEITNSDKSFVFDKSEIYFTAKEPIDPQLNLNLHYYTADDMDIEIFITNRLSSPVVIFSSKPAMSQNDIISYILFGEPASALFESSDGDTKISASSLLLGTGLKQMFSQSAGIKIDTLNILTNKEGTLGYEIGSRYNKDIRILYRNDTASSVVVQYSLSKSLRVDVDVVQTGQGINIIYVKDF